jgi:hypothetical protein
MSRDNLHRLLAPAQAIFSDIPWAALDQNSYKVLDIKA